MALLSGVRACNPRARSSDPGDIDFLSVHSLADKLRRKGDVGPGGPGPAAGRCGLLAAAVGSNGLAVAPKFTANSKEVSY
jgi:hypothetical protein